MTDWIDITRPLTNGMIHWPGDLTFHWRRVAEITGPGTANVSEISTTTHIGTHIDAPLHFIPDGLDVARLPLTALCGPAVVVDVPEPRDVVVQDLAKADIERGVRVLLRTVNRLLWSEPGFVDSYHGVTMEAARWLVEHEVPLVGVDYLSVDRFEKQDQPAHYALLGGGTIILEGLDLSAVSPGRYELVALPLKIPGADGSPARAIIRPEGSCPSRGDL